MGRTVDQQHRGFLDRMIGTGDWERLATTTETDPSSWLKAIERAAEGFEDDQPYLRWYGRFFDLYILARWLPRYAHAFLSLPERVAQTGQPKLRQVLRIATDPRLSGSGLWAPAIDRTLGLAACFVVRELVRFGILDGAQLGPHAWMPTARLRNLFQRLGCREIVNNAALENAPVIWRFVSRRLGDERARFGGAFDLPLQLATPETGTLEELVERAGTPGSFAGAAVADADDYELDLDEDVA